MDDPGGVRGLERLGDLPANAERLLERKGPRCESLRECLTLHELEHEKWRFARVFKSVDRSDVRVIERSKRTRLAPEPSEPVRGSLNHVGQHLDRDLTIQFLIPGPVDLSHSSRPQRRENLVGTETRPRCESHPNRGSLRLRQPRPG